MSSVITTKQANSIVYSAGILIALALYGYAKYSISLSGLEIARLGQWYAFTSLAMLYCALLPEPLYAVFPAIPSKEVISQTRRAFIINALLFGTLHGALLFFISLGGFEGLGFLSPYFRMGVSLGFGVLTILLLLGLSSFNTIYSYLGSKWKVIHSFAYVAGVAILIHASLIGSHFSSLGNTIPQLIFFAVFLFLFLESVRIREIMYTWSPRIAYFFWIAIVILLLVGYYYLISTANNSLSHHGH